VVAFSPLHKPFLILYIILQQINYETFVIITGEIKISVKKREVYAKTTLRNILVVLFGIPIESF